MHVVAPPQVIRHLQRRVDVGVPPRLRNPWLRLVLQAKRQCPSSRLICLPHRRVDAVAVPLPNPLGG